MNSRMYFFLSFFILTLVAGTFITVEVITTHTPFLDQWSAPAVVGLENTWVFNVFRWITELGSGTFLTPFTVIAAVVLWRFCKDWLAALILIFGVLSGYLANFWIKSLIQRERPRVFAAAEGEGFSFPSGHAMVSMAAYGLLAYFLIKYVKSKRVALLINIAALILILLIGLSRYVIRVHYLTDVLGGYVFGFIVIVIWVGLYQFLTSFSKGNSSKKKF